jgi:hypothetical protein
MRGRGKDRSQAVHPFHRGNLIEAIHQQPTKRGIVDNLPNDLAQEQLIPLPCTGPRANAVVHPIEGRLHERGEIADLVFGHFGFHIHRPQRSRRQSASLHGHQCRSRHWISSPSERHGYQRRKRQNFFMSLARFMSIITSSVAQPDNVSGVRISQRSNDSGRQILA